MNTSAKQSGSGKAQRRRSALSSWITLAALCAVLLVLGIVKYIIPMIPTSMTTVLGNPRAHMDGTFVVRGEVQEVKVHKGPYGPIALYILKDKSGEGLVSDTELGKDPPKKGDVVSRRVTVAFNLYKTVMKTDADYMFVANRD